MKIAGIIKLLVIGINVAMIFMLPWPNEPDQLLTSPIIPFPFMSVLVPCYYILVKKEKGEHLKWPNWNTNVFNPKGDSTFGNVDFCGIAFLAIGLAMTLSNKIYYDTLSHVGLTSISFGLGILFGLAITITIGKRIKDEQ